MTTENSVQKKIVSAAMLVAPLALGAVFALALGFTAPSAANADGMDGGYGGGFIDGDDGGYSGGYVDDSYGGYGGGYIDNGYGGYSGGYIDDGYDTNYGGGYSGGYIDDYGASSFDYNGPSSFDYNGPSSFDYNSGSSYGDYGNYGGNYGGGYDYGSGYGSYPTYSYSSYPSSYSDSYYDYSYDYVYEREYIYEYDECTNLSGLQAKGYDCYPDRDHDDDDLDCDITADDRTVEEGDEVTLEWDIEGDADYASINQGVGRVDEDGGEEEVEVDEDTTFRLTVRDGNDEATCSVTIRVDEDDNTFSSIDFEGEPANNPPQVVYLSSIPYTGLEDISPAMLSYWLMLIAGAGMLGWFLVKNGFVPTFAFASAQAVEEAPASDVATDEAPAATENAFVSALNDGDIDRAIDGLRDGAVQGTSIEDALEEAAKAAEGAALESRINAALEASRVNGIRGVKASLAV